MEQLWWVPSIQAGSSPARSHTHTPLAASPAAFSDSDACLLSVCCSFSLKGLQALGAQEMLFTDGVYSQSLDQRL